MLMVILSALAWCGAARAAAPPAAGAPLATSPGLSNESPPSSQPAAGAPLAFSPVFSGATPPATQPDAAAPVPVKLALVNKDQLAGRLLTLGGGQLTLAPSVAAGTLLSLRLEQVTRLTVEPAAAPGPTTQPADQQTLRLKDGTLLIGRFVTLTRESLRFAAAGIGPVDLPRRLLMDWAQRRLEGREINFAAIQLPAGGGGEVEVRVHQLKSADAQRVAEVLDELFKTRQGQGRAVAGGPVPRFVADKRTHSLIVAASPGTHRMVESLIAQLDGERVPGWTYTADQGVPRPPGSDSLHVVRTNRGDLAMGELDQPADGRLRISGAAVEATFAVASLASIDFPTSGPAATTQPETAAWAVETADSMRLVGREPELKGDCLWLTIAGENRVSWPMGQIKSLSPLGTEREELIGTPVIRDPTVPVENEDTILWNIMPDGLPGPAPGWERRVRPGEDYFDQDAILQLLFGEM